MKQNIFIAALLAGMLALAGCGGGSSSSPETPETPVTPETPTASGPSKVTAAPGATASGYGVPDSGDSDSITVKAGETTTFGGSSGDVYSCAAGADCVVSLRNSGGTLEIMSTGTLAYVAPAPAQPPAADPADAMQVNAASIQAAIEGGLIHGFGLDGNGAIADTPIVGNHTFPHADGTMTTLNLNVEGLDDDAAPGVENKGEDYVFWGRWNRAAEGVSNVQPRFVYGGSIPYGKKPGGVDDLDDITGADADAIATYLGTDNAYISHSSNGKTWTSAQTNASLTANFANSTINGTIGNVGTADTLFGGTEDNNILIMLKSTSFTSDKFNGSAEFGTLAGTSDENNLFNKAKPRVNKGSGSWEGQFFGQTLQRNGDEHAPNFVAGQFSVERKAVTGVDNPLGRLIVHGSFGAATTEASLTGAN